MAVESLFIYDAKNAVIGWNAIIEINKYLYFTGKEDFEGKEYGIIKTTDIVKHSKQLIDLIDFGDFVNGIKVVEKGLDKNDNVSSFSNGHDEVRAKDIKAILTKEQMEANQYVVKWDMETN